MSKYKNSLEQIIYTKCYDTIFQELSRYVQTYPNSLEIKYSRVKYPDDATLSNMMIEFATNVAIIGDSISFDVIVSSEIELSEQNYNGSNSDSASQWFRITCSFEVAERIKNIVVHKVEVYSKSGQFKAPEKASNNFVPKIYKEDLDDEATRFLEQYCPEALTTPMAIPINQIVRDGMGLTVVTGHRLTNDFSLFGQICFSGGPVKLYDLIDDTYSEKEVERGTILIDENTFWERNLGCVNNTLAHEAFHWHRHRVYAAVRSMLRNEKVVACRCPVNSATETRADKWTDEERMEWQANNVAPRILMPRETVLIKIQQLYDIYGYCPDGPIKTEILERVIDELAQFYNVSKQAAKIRMTELGFSEAKEIYNYSNNQQPYFSHIIPRDAFYEYCDNEEFRVVLNTGLFCYVDGYLIINDPLYVARENNNVCSLSDYAWNNLAECVLQFTYRQVNIGNHGVFHTDTFHRTNKNAFEKLPHYDAERNISVIDNAEALSRKQAEFADKFSEYQKNFQTFGEKATAIMKRKHWNSTIFKERTLLDDMAYSRIINSNDSLPSLRTVMAVCIGLGLDIQLATSLLASAGYSLGTSREHQLYHFLLTAFEGKSIDECNVFLESMDVKPLGTQTKRPK